MTPGRPFGSTKLRWFLTCNRLKQHKWSPRRACRFWWRHCLRMSIPLHEPEGWAEKTKEAIDAYRSQSYPIIRSGMVWGTWNKIGTTKSTSRTSTSSDSLWSVCVVSGTKQRNKKSSKASSCYLLWWDSIESINQTGFRTLPGSDLQLVAPGAVWKPR